MNNKFNTPTLIFLQKHTTLYLLFAMFLVLGFANDIYAQTKFTRAEFSRLPLMSRAAFFEREILKAAQAEGVDPNILWAIAYNETRFRPWLRSPKNAKGLMQFIPATAKRFNLQNPYDPIPSIRAAARYVKYLSGMFGGRIDSILAAYNSGEGTVSAYLTGRTLKTKRKVINRRGIRTIGGVPPYRETIHYVGQGLKIYRWLIRFQKFPASSVRSDFPNVISKRVARVFFSDPGLGKVPARNKTPIQRTTMHSAKTVGLIVEKVESAQKTDLNQTKLKEVYYDPRSGSRYLVENGKKIKLSDSGVLVVDSNLQGEKTSRARSTFFARNDFD